jgi:hypothetical protein
VSADADWRAALMTVGGRYPGGVFGAMGAQQIQRGGMWESGIVPRTTWSMTIVVPDGVARIVARGSAGPAVALTVHNNVAIGLHLPGRLRCTYFLLRVKSSRGRGAEERLEVA